MSGVKRYNMDVDKFGHVRAYESEHGRWVKRGGYAALEAERDALRAQVEAMRAALLSLLTLDVKGHLLLERLQFSTKGREILEKVNAALQANP